MERTSELGPGLPKCGESKLCLASAFSQDILVMNLESRYEFRVNHTVQLEVTA